MVPRQRWVRALSLAGLALAVVSASGFTRFATTRKPTTISFWESHSASNPPGMALGHLIQQFNHTHRLVKVNLTITKASHKALGALAAGDAPVVAWISHYDGNFLNAHALQPWNPYLKTVPVAEKRSFYPVVWGNGIIGQQHYRIQADAKISELVYNKAIFAKAGLSSFPTTWTELAKDASIIKQRVPGVIPLAWKDSSAHILPPFLSNGGKLFRPGTHQRQVDFLTPAASQTFNYFRTLYHLHELVIAHGSAIAADFGAGKIAIADGTSAGYLVKVNAAHGAFAVGAAPYPKGSTGHSANIDQGLGFVLMIHHTPAQYRAATTFLSWWFSAKTQAYWGSHSGYPPVTRAGLALIPKNYFVQHPGVAVSVKTLASPFTISRPISDAYKEVQSALDTAFFNAVTGRTSVQSALHTLQRQANAYLSGKSEL